jgi:hypothetical protein
MLRFFRSKDIRIGSGRSLVSTTWILLNLDARLTLEQYFAQVVSLLQHLEYNTGPLRVLLSSSRVSNMNDATVTVHTTQGTTAS